MAPSKLEDIIVALSIKVLEQFHYNYPACEIFAIGFDVNPDYGEILIHLNNQPLTAERGTADYFNYWDVSMWELNAVNMYYDSWGDGWDYHQSIISEHVLDELGEFDDELGPMTMSFIETVYKALLLLLNSDSVYGLNKSTGVEGIIFLHDDSAIGALSRLENYKTLHKLTCL